MRVVAELPHPRFKITLFSMNGKFIIKFEQGTLEQTYKLPESAVAGGANSVFEIIDDEFIESIANRFNAMRTDFNEAYKRHEY